MTTSAERPRLTDEEPHIRHLRAMRGNICDCTMPQDIEAIDWVLAELAEARQALALAAEALAEADSTLWALRDHCESRGDVAGANTCNQLGFRLRAAREAGEEGNMCNDDW